MSEEWILKHGQYEIVKTLSNTKTYFYRAPGYCKCHCVFLTANQLKSRECLRKNCKHLYKIETHTYWEERRIKKANKKAKAA